MSILPVKQLSAIEDFSNDHNLTDTFEGRIEPDNLRVGDLTQDSYLVLHLLPLLSRPRSVKAR